jgi:hypothetical protein
MLLALLLAATPSPDIHVALAAGAGTAYGYAGVHLELTVDLLSVYAGAGVGAWQGGDAEWATGRYASRAGLPLAAGIRYSMNRDDALFVGATASYFPYRYPTDDGRWILSGSRYAYTLVVGYRLDFGEHFFGELGLGGGFAKAVDNGPTSYLGTVGPPRNAIEFQPDGALAVGVRF